MGKVNASLVTTLLADRFGCRAVVFSGVAGGLDPALAIGDIVVADRVIQHDAGVLEDERVRVYQPGHAPIINPTDRLGYPADPELLVRVRDRLDGMAVPGQIVYGTVLSGDQYLNCGTTRDRLRHELGGHAIEMEGGAVAQVCEAFGIPWLVIRALSDLAGGGALFDFTTFVDQAAATSATILRRLLPVL
jgi:adenosylhomocysteine nucleosidase